MKGARRYIAGFAVTLIAPPVLYLLLVVPMWFWMSAKLPSDTSYQINKVVLFPLRFADDHGPPWMREAVWHYIVYLDTHI